jgi:hypothetical protein
MDFGERLTRKLGPLPVWGWGVLIGGAFIAWYWYSNTGLGSFDGETDEEGTGVGQTLAPSGDFSTVPIMPEEEAETDENTNAEWLIQAVLAAPAGTSKLAAQAALEKYLNGTDMSAAEQNLVDAIINKIGLPPQGTAGPPQLEPKPPTAGETNWATRMWIGAPNKTRFGGSALLNVRVVWVDSTGHTTEPRGNVETSLDGAMKKTQPLINGRATRVLIMGRNVAQFKDKVVVLNARYVPPAGANAKASSANPTTMRIS